jgi:hypothetical protein
MEHTTTRLTSQSQCFRLQCHAGPGPVDQGATTVARPVSQPFRPTPSVNGPVGHSPFAILII